MAAHDRIRLTGPLTERLRSPGPFLSEDRELRSSSGYADVCSRMIVCILKPRFELAVAAGGREALASGPLALAPELGREPLIGEPPAAAEAYGVRAGLRLGEALARCPTLRLVTPDPAGVADAWEHIVTALEGIGAGVESERPGMGWFEERGLRGVHGGTLESVLTTVRRALASAPGS